MTVAAGNGGGARDGHGVWRWAAIVACGLVAAIATLAVVAPAALADLALNRASQGRVRVADTQGTLWHGSGRVVFQDSTAPRSGALLQGMVLPGRIHWDVKALPLLLGLVQADVIVDGMPQPLRINGAIGELRLGAGSIELPPIDLARLGSPWNTIRPVAGLSLRWDPLSIRGGALEGKASVELRDVGAAITPVRPLGNYRIDATSSGREVALSLVTLSGPLMLEGSGRWDTVHGLRFKAQAWAQGPDQARLQAVLGLIGRLEANRTVIRIGE